MTTRPRATSRYSRFSGSGTRQSAATDDSRISVVVRALTAGATAALATGWPGSAHVASTSSAKRASGSTPSGTRRLMGFLLRPAGGIVEHSATRESRHAFLAKSQQALGKVRAVAHQLLRFGFECQLPAELARRALGQQLTHRQECTRRTCGELLRELARSGRESLIIDDLPDHADLFRARGVDRSTRQREIT